MNQLLKCLPNEISSHIFGYISDCVGIPANLSKDIRHLVECKQIINAVPDNLRYHKHKLAHDSFLYSYMTTHNLFTKYNRKMVCDIQYRNIVTLENLQEYMFHVRCEHFFGGKPTAIPQDLYFDLAYKTRYCSIHNVLCQLDVKDRTDLMNKYPDYAR